MASDIQLEKSGNKTDATSHKDPNQSEIVWNPLVDRTKTKEQIMFAQCCKPGPCSPKQ